MGWVAAPATFGHVASPPGSMRLSVGTETDTVGVAATSDGPSTSFANFTNGGPSSLPGSVRAKLL